MIQMEDENSLELSLALPSNGCTATATAKTGTSSEARSNTNDRDTKLINEFKHFLDGGTSQIGSGMASQMKPENFFGNSSKAPVDVETSRNLNTGGFCITDDRHAEGSEENRPDVREKRKNVFGEMSQQKKHEKEIDHIELHDRSRASHISINTDDGSTAENEDVADSEADASTSRPLLQSDNVARQSVGSSLNELHKDFHGVSHSKVVEAQGTKRFSISSENDFKVDGVSQGVQFPSQAVNMVSMNHLNPAGMSVTSMYPLPGMMQVAATTSNERTGSQPVLAANSPLVVGYPPLSLPTLDKDNSRILVAHHQQLNQSCFSRGHLNTDKHNDDLKMNHGSALGIPPKSSEYIQHGTKAVDHALGSMRQPVEGGSATHAEDGLRAISTTSRPNDVTDLPRTDAFPSEYPTIKPGIGADLKFGGCGSYPNLPWVSTTGSGPNGRTISGVTYRYSPTQIRIVCACHGTHLSPEEFVHHASEEHVNQDASGGVPTVAASNPATSAKG